MFDQYRRNKRVEKQLLDILTFEKPTGYFNNKTLIRNQKNRILDLKTHARILLNKTNADVFNKDAIDIHIEQAKKSADADSAAKHSQNLLLIPDLVKHRLVIKKNLEASLEEIQAELEKIESEIKLLEDKKKGAK